MRTLVKKLDFYVPLEKLAKNSQKERSAHSWILL